MKHTDEKGGYIVRDSPSSYRVVLTEDHMCGLQGYNPMLGDTCPGCEQSRNLREGLRKLECIAIYARDY